MRPPAAAVAASHPRSAVPNAPPPTRSPLRPPRPTARTLTVLERITTACAAVPTGGADGDSEALVPTPRSLPTAAEQRSLALNPADYGPGDAVGDYQIVSVLGRGATGVTYRATKGGAPPDAPPVALKVTRLRGPGGWKAFDLAAREAAALKALKHPGIPAFVDSFDVDTPTDTHRVLAQAAIEGVTLADVVASGSRGTPADVDRLARGLLDILAYLASRAPPIVHRDVKPSNIVLAGGTWGGAPTLVDFGGVQAMGGGAGGEGDALAGLPGGAPAPPGTTIVGTAGYMAPETIWAASPASDMYSLGGVLVYALTGKPPSSFAGGRLRVDTRALGDVPPALAAVIAAALEPAPEDRPTAAAALAALEGGPSSLAGLAPLPTPRPPPGARCRVALTGRALVVDVPPAPLFSGDRAGSAVFSLVWNGTIAAWTASALAAGALSAAAFSLPFWIAGLAVTKDALGGSLQASGLTIGPRTWRLETRPALGALARAGRGPSVAEGDTTTLRGARVAIVAIVNGVPRTRVKLVDGFNAHSLGEGLPRAEQAWLVETINAHVAALTGTPVAVPPADDPPPPPPGGGWYDDHGMMDDGFGRGNGLMRRQRGGAGYWGGGPGTLPGRLDDDVWR